MTTPRCWFPFIAVLVLAGGGSAWSAEAVEAEPRPASRPGQRWLERLDRDGDGRVSPAEREEARRRMQGSRGRVAASRPAEVVPPDARILRDLEYARVEGKPLRLDLYLPPGADRAEPLPVLVWVHGGGWQAGSKNNCPLAPLCGRGYAVVSVQYRLTDAATFPAQIHDCKGAVRWIRANATKYNLDPRRIGAAGGSAGGHLVALLGTSGDLRELEGDVGGNLDHSSRVQAVCDFCGPADFVGRESVLTGADGREPQALIRLFGGPLSENREKARLASPVVHVSADDPPFLIIHGDEDPLVPVSQSERLAAALKQAGVDATLHVVKGGGHGVIGPDTLAMAAAFFDKHLKTGGER